MAPAEAGCSMACSMVPESVSPLPSPSGDSSVNGKSGTPSTAAAAAWPAQSHAATRQTAIAKPEGNRARGPSGCAPQRHIAMHQRMEGEIGHAPVVREHEFVRRLDDAVRFQIHAADEHVV